MVTNDPIIAEIRRTDLDVRLLHQHLAPYNVNILPRLAKDLLGFSRLGCLF